VQVTGDIHSHVVEELDCDAAEQPPTLSTPGGRPVTPADDHLDSPGALLYDQHGFGI